MIFWIVLGIAIVAIIVSFIHGLLEDIFGGIVSGFMYALLAATLSGLVGGAIILIVALTTPWQQAVTTGVDHHPLRAISAGDGLHGAFYLGSGYINSERVLSYITQDGAAIHVGSASGDHSTVYEDGGKVLDVTHAEIVDPWVFPWTLPQHDTYTFHVPAGSVQDGYAVRAK